MFITTVLRITIEEKGGFVEVTLNRGLRSVPRNYFLDFTECISDEKEKGLPSICFPFSKASELMYAENNSTFYGTYGLSQRASWALRESHGVS